MIDDQHDLVVDQNGRNSDAIDVLKTVPAACASAHCRRVRRRPGRSRRRRRDRFLPSDTGLGDAGLLRASSASLRSRGASRRHRILPVARSSAMVRSLSPSYAVTKMCPPTRMGDEWPGGSGVFQTRFLSGPNSAGTFDGIADAQAVGSTKARPVGGRRERGGEENQGCGEIHRRTVTPTIQLICLP